MKRSKTLWVVTIFFAWAALKSAGSIYGAPGVVDYAILSAVGLGALFYVINVPLMLGEAAAAWLLLERKAGALLVSAVVISLEIVNGIFVGAIAVLHPDDAKAFYAASRAARGLVVKQENIDSIVSVHGMTLALAAYVAFYALVFYFVRRVRPELASKAA